MTDNFELIKITEDYKSARRAAKDRARKQLEAGLEPEKAALGKAIAEARTKRGLTIDEIGLIIGIKNRTFIYDMINAHNRASGGSIVTETASAPVTAQPPYTIEFLDDSDTAVVTFDEDEFYYLYCEGSNGSFEIPEEWADHTKERRALYKEIITTVRQHFKN